MTRAKSYVLLILVMFSPAVPFFLMHCGIQFDKIFIRIFTSISYIELFSSYFDYVGVRLAFYTVSIDFYIPRSEII